MKLVIRAGYAVLAWILFADICLQFYFAGWGAFSRGRADFAPHDLNANLVALLMLVTLLVAILAALTSGLLWSRVGWHGLLVVLWIGQILLFILNEALGGTDTAPLSYILGLHAVNGLLMFTLSLYLAVRALTFVRTGPVPSGEPAAPSG